MSQDRTVPIEQTARLVRTLRVEVVSGPDAGKSLRSDADRLTVGTADGNDLVLGDRTVSRYHLELQRKAGRIAAVDLGSTNGTRVGKALIHSSSVLIDAGGVLEL